MKKNIHFRFKTSLFGLLAITLLVGCGDDHNETPTTPDNGTSISGVVTLPGGGGDLGQSSSSLFKQLKLQSAQNTHNFTDDQTSEIIPGEYLITLNQGINTQNLQTLQVAGHTLERDIGIPSLGIWIYKLSTAQPNLSLQSSNTVLNQLKNLSSIKNAEPNRTLHTFKTPNDSFYPLMWHLRAMNLPQAWDVTTGNNITVAVVDSGIIKHPDLTSNVLPGIDMVSKADSGDGDGRDNDPTDPNNTEGYHGAHVAGTIAAASNNKLGITGVSWGAKILPVRALYKGGSAADIFLGAAWAAGLPVKGLPTNPNPAKIINMSLGGKSPCLSAVQQILNAIKAKGVITVVAAGNSNDDANDYMPASCKNVITIGATGPDGARAPYSNYGSRIDLMAPGGDTNKVFEFEGNQFLAGVLSTVLNNKGEPFYAFYQGTSMATPHISGAIALLLSKQPNLKPDDVTSKLKAASTPLGSKCDKPNGCGAGLLNAAALLNNTGGTPTPPPAPPKTSKVPLMVAALYELTDGGFDEKRSVSGIFTPQSLKVPYTLQQLTKGTYRIAAWQDMNKNKKVDNGEPFGVFPQALKVSGQSNKIPNINIRMQAFSSNRSYLNLSKSKTSISQALQNVTYSK